MRKRLLLSYIVLIAIMLVSFIWIVNSSLGESIQSQYEDHFISELNLIEALVLHMDPARPIQTEFEKLTDLLDARITVIDVKGKVLADTYEDPSVMDNHINREEVQAVMHKGGVGISIRYSDTIKENFMYAVKRIMYQGRPLYLRLSKPMVELKSVNQEVQRFAMVLAVITSLVAGIMGVFLSLKLTIPIDQLIEASKKMTQGNYEDNIHVKGTDEINKLAKAFNLMRANLAETLEDLSTRNAELQAILNSMVNGMIAVDCDQQIMMINQRTFEILNLPESFAGVQDSMYKIIKNQTIISMIQASLTTGDKQYQEIEHHHLDKILKVYVHPISNGDQILGSMVILDDITQIRKLEVMRSDFVSNVSHELKTPLTSILGFVDTLRAGAAKDPSKSDRFLGIIETEAQRLHRLINDILYLSDIEGTSVEQEVQSTHLQVIMDEVIDMLSIHIKDKPVELSFETRQDMVIMANHDCIKQLFINLVDNAIKYTEVGYVHVHMTKEGDKAVVKIEDTGIGITEDHKKRLFERFYRVDKARSRKEGGTGLGLSIVKHILNIYKGEIEVESSVGEGSTFTVKLPLI